jgi:translation initiation factor 1
MQKKTQKKLGLQALSSGMVYSTDPNFSLSEPETSVETPEPAEQQLRIRYDTKHRAGKAVSLVTGFVGAATDIDALGKALKTYCGTGGSVKDGEVILQGDHRDKLLQWCLKNGYTRTKKF